MPASSIFVIEDDAATCEYIDLLLQWNGYTVFCGKTSLHAIEQIIEQQPDLVLLDHRLDDSDNGWTIFEAIRNAPSIAHIPVILCSAEHDVLREHGAQLRASNGATLAKPFMPQRLLDTIQALIETKPDEQPLW